jgi:ABC-2 type transport system ATP-binding protein
LLLDEPTVGLDPIEAERLRKSVAALRDTGVTVLLTSHYLLDIERLAGRVLVLADGKVAADLEVAAFARMAGYTATITVRGTGPAPEVDALASVEIAVDELIETADLWTLRLRVRDWGVDSFGHLGHALGGANIVSVDVAPVRLEDVYASVAEDLARSSADPAHRSAGAAG